MESASARMCSAVTLAGLRTLPAGTTSRVFWGGGTGGRGHVCRLSLLVCTCAHRRLSPATRTTTALSADTITTHPARLLHGRACRNASASSLVHVRTLSTHGSKSSACALLRLGDGTVVELPRSFNVRATLGDGAFLVREGEGGDSGDSGSLGSIVPLLDNGMPRDALVPGSVYTVRQLSSSHMVSSSAPPTFASSPAATATAVSTSAMQSEEELMVDRLVDDGGRDGALLKEVDALVVRRLSRQAAQLKRHIDSLRFALILNTAPAKSTVSHNTDTIATATTTTTTETTHSHASTPRQTSPPTPMTPPFEPASPFLTPIGHIESVHPGFRGAAPRQGSVCPSSYGRLRVNWGLHPAQSLQGLSEYSHAWIIFLFSHNRGAPSTPVAHPPRLGGAPVGLFASRAPVRPSPIGLTLATIERVEKDVVHLGGVDLIDGTPVLDIKPYIPAYDAPRGDVRVASWVSGLSDDSLSVEYAPGFTKAVKALVPSMRLFRTFDRALTAITELIACDPRKIGHRPNKKHPGSEMYVFVVDGIEVTCMFPPGEKRAIALAAVPLDTTSPPVGNDDNVRV